MLCFFDVSLWRYMWPKYQGLVILSQLVVSGGGEGVQESNVKLTLVLAI